MLCGGYLHKPNVDICDAALDIRNLVSLDVPGRAGDDRRGDDGRDGDPSGEGGSVVVRHSDLVRADGYVVDHLHGGVELGGTPRTLVRPGGTRGGRQWRQLSARSRFYEEKERFFSNLVLGWV